ncbi:MAG: YmdB family metallophosphoesterase [Firmicutes bacterium]|nr:YmdB family metallophosphoesterase [Bacillota bacterium]
MDMKILAVGDVVGAPGLERIRRSLPAARKRCGADFVVVNGENASVVGITPGQAEELYAAGADVVTLGNHAFARREIVPYIDEHRALLRGANLPPQTPGEGWGVFDTRFGRVAVINLLGRVHMDYTPDNPFLLVEKILKKIDADVILVEIHAEATSEKLAMGYLLDGRVSAVWGTHTHVPTADAQILPGGTGYVTDLGMTGPSVSVLGIRPELSVARFRGDLTERYRWADGPTKLEAAVFTVDASTGRCRCAERMDIC